MRAFSVATIVEGEMEQAMISFCLTFNLCLIFLCPFSVFLFSRMVEYSLDLQNINLSAIRTVRVLRPLKAINRVPSKKTNKEKRMI